MIYNPFVNNYLLMEEKRLKHDCYEFLNIKKLWFWNMCGNLSYNFELLGTIEILQQYERWKQAASHIESTHRVQKSCKQNFSRKGKFFAQQFGEIIT